MPTILNLYAAGCVAVVTWRLTWRLCGQLERLGGRALDWFDR